MVKDKLVLRIMTLKSGVAKVEDSSKSAHLKQYIDSLSQQLEDNDFVLYGIKQDNVGSRLYASENIDEELSLIHI